MARHPNCKPLAVHWADIPEEAFDPGIAYSIKTPSGIILTKVNPAAARGSSAFVDYVNHHYSGRESDYKTQ